METLRAVDANRNFSGVLKQVAQGKEFLVVSRGKPVATILPPRRSAGSSSVAKKLLLDRLRTQEVTGTARGWSRDELYERDR